jgi:NhaP-type Na+/H+ and K+/H+ antiporter
VLIVEPPQLPLKPVWPDPVKIFLGAWVVGLFLSIGVVLGADRVGAVLRTVEQAEEELGAKVIGTIPRIEGWSRPGSFIQNHWPAVSIAVLVVLTVLVTGVYTTVTTLHHGSPTTGETRR